MKAKGVLDKFFHMIQVFFRSLEIKCPQVFLYVRLYFEQFSGQYFFIGYGRFLEVVRYYVVYVFYENHVGIYSVEVFYQGAVSSGAENEFALAVAERLVVHIDGYRVG